MGDEAPSSGPELNGSLRSADPPPSSKNVRISMGDGLGPNDSVRGSMRASIRQSRGSFGTRASGRRSLRDSFVALKESVSENIERGTVAGTTLNTLCNVVGGGVLALPLAMRNSSIIPGLILLTFSALISAFSAVAITEACEQQQVFTLKELMEAALPNLRYAGSVVQAVIFMNNYGILIVYSRVIADSIPPVLANFVGAHGIWIKTLTWLIIPAVFFFALSCARNMEELKWTSLLGITTIMYVVFLVLVDFFKRDYHSQYISDSVHWFHLEPSIFKSLPTCALAFGYHYNIPVFYGELQNRTTKKMNFTTILAFSMVLVIYIATGLCGYFTFGKHVADKDVGGSIMNNFSNDDIPANIGRLGLFFHFACVYPMISVGARNSLHTFVAFVTKTSPNPRLPVVAVEALAIVATSVVLAGVVPGIALVIEITGSLFGVAIISTIPGIIAFKLLREREKPSDREDALLLAGTSTDVVGLSRKAKIGAVVVVLGVFLSIAGFTVTIVQAV